MTETALAIRDGTMVTEKQAMRLTGLHKYELKGMALAGMIRRFGRSRGAGHYVRAQLEPYVKRRGGAGMTAAQMEHELRELRQEVQLLGRGLRIMAQAVGCPHVTFTPTDEELNRLYNTAVRKQGHFSGKRKPSTPFVNRWFSIASRLTVQDFRRLNRMNPSDPHPWLPVWLLTEQMKYAHAQQDLQLYAHESAVLHHRLSVCLDAMKEAVLLYCAIADPRRDPRRTMSHLLVTIGQVVAQTEVDSMMLDEPLPDPADAIRELDEI